MSGIKDMLGVEEFKFLKWVEIITNENEAVKNSAMYILQKDLEFCDLIFVSDKGKKRKVGGISKKYLEEKFTKLDLSNLNDEQKGVWKEALGVGSIPDNVALVDLGESPEVFNKNQIRAMAMMIADYTVGGKIRADKIEALGLTDLIEASENTLAAFVANSGNYEFQKNDFIALPDMNGNFSLFMFKGGNKSVVVNYLPTGLTKITIAMVEGLQSALDGKMGKPTQNGSFFAKNTNGLTSWQNINAGASYLLFWDGDNFKTSSIFREASGNKFGIGTASPTEQLHLIGRARMSALVLDDNSETLPNQITKNGNRFYGSNSSAIKRGLMYNDAADLTATMANYSDAEKDAWRLAQRKSDETYSLGQPRVDSYVPSIIDNSLNYYQTVTLVGLNLFLNNSSPNSAFVTLCRVKDENGNTLNPINGVYATEYPITNFEVYQVNTKLFNIRESFDNWLQGEYSARVVHNGISNIISTSNTLMVRSNIVSQPISLTYKILDQDVKTGSIAITDSTSPNISLNNNIGFHTYAAQSNEPVATLQEQIDGVALYFKVIQGPEINANRDTMSGAALFTLVTQRPIEANDISEISLYKSGVWIVSKPNGSSLDTGTHNPIDDTLIVMFKDNFIKLILVNIGYVSIMAYSPVGDLYLKALLTYYKEGWQQGSNSIYIEPIKKVNL